MLFSDGERYPVLLNEAGAPEWLPSLYATSQLRNGGLAPSTVRASLDSIRLLVYWANGRGIRLEERFSQRKFLSENEAHSLTRRLKNRAAQSSELGKPIVLSKHRYRVRAAIGAAEKQVDSQTSYNRITNVAAYLEWLARYLMERDAKGLDASANADIELMVTSLKSDRAIRRKSIEDAREGLDASQQEKLEALSSADGISNPFEPAVRSRNALIVELLNLGVRAGELLSLKVSDFDLQANTVRIDRRHGDSSDPRKNQPVVKTLDRLLPITDDLAGQLTRYVMKERHSLMPARRHPFLLVTHKAGPFLGKPMSYKALAKLFTKLRSAAGGLLDGVSPHSLRHTANERMSEQMDAAGVSPAREEKMRSYTMGWQEGSGTAATYTRRHTKREAMKASLRMQKARLKERGRED